MSPRKDAESASCPISVIRIVGGALVLSAMTAMPAFAQPTFSIDYQSGGTIGVIDFFTGTPINEGDILLPFGGLPLPGPYPVPPPANVGILTFAGGPSFGPDLGLPAFLPPPYAPGIPNLVEVDALSYGTDTPIDPLLPPHVAMWVFSVDEHAVGIPVSPAPPDVTSEGAFGTADAADDVFVSFPPGIFPPFPFPPGGAGPGNTLLFDGDGVAPPFIPVVVPLPPTPPGSFWGLGLIEGPPTPFAVPDAGDNLDAIDADSPPPLATFPIYFSLDGSFPDPIETVGPPPNSSSALANAFVGGDVLVTVAPAGPPAVFVPAATLGLDIFGADTDDLDALVLVENGTGLYEQSVVDFDWIGGATDMLFFSVRRGSALIAFGVPDSRFGVPIEEGDVLTPPPAGSPPGTPPGIWMAAENFGLATVRSGVPLFGGPPFIADELDALDVVTDCDGTGIPDVYDFIYGTPGVVDCNGNGRNDFCDIAIYMTSLDCNANGVPDECDISGFSLDCDGNSIPDECTTEADCDCDGDVDGVDFSVFASCFNKAGNPPRTFGCPPAWAIGFDQDGDGDVDGVDFSVFASCYNKAGNPPRSPCNMP